MAGPIIVGTYEGETNVKLNEFANVKVQLTVEMRFVGDEIKPSQVELKKFNNVGRIFLPMGNIPEIKKVIDEMQKMINNGQFSAKNMSGVPLDRDTLLKAMQILREQYSTQQESQGKKKQPLA